MYPNKFDKPHRNIVNFDNMKITDLFTRVNNMNIHEIKQFMLMENIPLSVVDNNNNTLIHIVLMNSNDTIKTEQQRLTMIRFLYNEGVNPDAMNNMNTTPLHIACMKQYSSIVDYLVKEVGVNTNYTDNNMNTPLHHFFSGKIRLEELNDSGIRGLIIPKSKKIDQDRIDEWKRIRSNIWIQIKDSPYLSAIVNTMRTSIDNTIDKTNILVNFQNKLLNLDFSHNNDINKMDKIKRITEIRNESINDLKSTIGDMWNNFTSIESIDIHPSTTSSRPSKHVTGLGIIRDADPELYIKNQLDDTINNIDNLIEKNIDNININTIYDNIKIDFDTKNPNYKELTDMENNYMNEYLHENAVDFASDIIDWKTNSFIGGARIVGIVSYTPANLINLLGFDQRKVIQIMAYSLVDNNFDQVFRYVDNYLDVFDHKQWNLSPNPPHTKTTSQLTGNNIRIDDKKRLDDMIIHYIVEIIEDNLNIMTETELITHINNYFTNTNISYKYLIKLIKIRNTCNKASWLYTFATSYVCIENFTDYNNPLPNNMECNISQLFIYLISGIANCKGNDNLLLSISQVCRPRLIEDYSYNMNGFFSNAINIVVPYNYNIGSIYSSWIYLLLTNEVDVSLITANINLHGRVVDGITIYNYINTLTISQELKYIIVFTFNYFNNIKNKDEPAIFNNVLNWLKLPKDNILSECEILCKMITTYYNMMEQAPLLQNVVDTIHLIRYYSKYNNRTPQFSIHMLGRLKTLYEKPFLHVFNNANDPLFNITTNKLDPNNTIHQYIDNELVNIMNPMSNFFKIFNMMDESSIELFLLNEYCLPSKINFYLTNGFNSVDIPNVRMKLYLYKKIISSHFGLCFMDCIKNYEPNIPQLPAGSVLPPEGDNIYFSLFNFYNFPNPVSKIYECFYTNRKERFNRPATTIAYYNVMNSIARKSIKLRNKVIETMKSTMNNLQVVEKSSIYSTMISYIYPILKNLVNYDSILKQMIHSYGHKHNNNNIDFNEMYNKIDSFEIFNISDFETSINYINSYLYLSYYMKSDNKVKIPKFLYHQLDSNNPFILFNKNNNIIYPTNEVIIDPTSKTAPTNIIDKYNNINGDEISYNGYYSYILDNLNNNNFDFSKEEFKKSFITSKKSKLPPSLHNILYDFYKLNTIELIKETSRLININDKYLPDPNINTNMKEMHKLLICSKIIEELVQLYLKNKLTELSVITFNKFITNKHINETGDSSDLFNSDFVFNFDMDKMVPSRLDGIDVLRNDGTIIIQNIYTINKILMNYNKIFTTVTKNKDVFYIYPCDYNGTSLINVKYTLHMDPNILKTLIENRADIFIHNNENNSSIIKIIQNNYYPMLNTLKRYGIDNRIYNTNNIDSPYVYLIKQYKIHTEKYIDKNFNNNKDYIMNFISSQYNDVKQTIQANDSYNNNILLNLELSFSICNYMVQQFLTENIIRFKNKFNNMIFNNTINNNIPQNVSTYILQNRYLYYRENIDRMNIPSKNEYNILQYMINDYNRTIYNYIIKLEEYDEERQMLIDSTSPTRNIDIKIQKITDERDNIRDARDKLVEILYTIPRITKNSIIQNSIVHIIDRYDDMLNRMSRNNINKMRGNYIHGWRELLNRYSNDSPDLFISKILKMESIILNQSYLNINSINPIQFLEYYKHLNEVSCNYFETPRYTNKNYGNKTLQFVYDMLIHLTQNILCYSFELIVRKILYESFLSIETYLPDRDDFNSINNKIKNIMTDEIIGILYNEVAIKLVKNSVNIFDSIEDKSNHNVETTSEILLSLLDLIKTSSISINPNTINVIKLNIIPYFDTITNKTITNWNVCAENIFLFCINQYRMIEMIVSSI